MNRSVWKYDIAIEGSAHAIPIGARLVHVAAQDVAVPDFFSTWWEVDVDKPKALHTFVVVGTGHAIPDDYQYRGTALCANGRLVWHLYEGAA